MVTQEQQSIIDHAQLQKINGWQHIKVKGTPYECGFQEGYLLADEYQDALRVYKFMTLETFGMTYEWFAEQALKLHRDKIPTRWLEELRGMAEGLTAAGIPATTDDMIAWNDWMEITGYWWPQNAGKVMSRPLMKTHRKEHCSAIVATGSATVDGKPYLGHESFDEFWSGQYFNVCKRVEPDDGYAFIMQASAPCMLSSMTDFYVTAAGLNITETTLAGFDRYDDAGMPEWVRIRDAVQYAATIDEFVERGTLVTSAEQEHDLAIGKRSERLERRIDVGRLGIVEEIDAVNRTAGLETMLERLETQEPFANARRLASTRKRGTCGTKGVLDVMGTLDRELARLRKFDAPSPPILDDERPVCIRESAGSLALGADGHELDAMLVQQRMKLGVGLENGIGDDGR